MFRGLRIAVVIPALDEERAIGRVLAEIPDWVDDVVVVDNGSTDKTARVAETGGARVVFEERRGYGSACQAGIRALDAPDVVVFLDADHSDHPAEMPSLLAPIAEGTVDLVIGSRVRGRAARGSLTPTQRFGNALSCALLRVFFRAAFTDLGPFRAIRREALERLGMSDPDYGWTVEMQARAARLGLRCAEVPVSYRRRIGVSKISGTLAGVVGAGTKILGTIAKEALGPRGASRTGAVRDERLVVFARAPEAGKAKTRLIPLLGPEGAAGLYAEMLGATLRRARSLARRRSATVEVRVTADGPTGWTRRFARGMVCRDQGAGDLGARMRRGAKAAFSSSARRVVLVGSDCPMLEAGGVSEAFDALEDPACDVVLGPALDGGYTLIGMKRLHPALFEGMPWGESGVLARTLEAAEGEGLRVRLLSPLPDLDRPEDVVAWAASRGPAPDERPWLSVVVPTLDEAARLPATLASILLGAEGVEIVVADGGSRDRTLDIARAFGAEIVTTSPSRGRQLNAGAARARGEVLLFLHADTRLPHAYDDAVRRTLARRGAVAGAFDLAIDGEGAGLRVVEIGVHLRTHVLGRPYGDQAMFVSADAFRRAGGFPDRPFMEDYVLLSRLGPHGRIRCADAPPVRTADRSWRAHGVWRVTLLHQLRILRHHLPRRVGRLLLPRDGAVLGAPSPRVRRPRSMRGVFVLLLFLLSLPALAADGGWPFGAGKGPMDRGQDLYNLGILGAKARDPSRGGNDDGPLRLLVEILHPDGPAARAGLAVGDVIVGIGRRSFREPALAPLAAALVKAESKKGAVALLVQRGGEGKGEKVEIQIPVGGKVMAKPTKEAARALVFEAALAWLAAEQQPGGGFPQTLSGVNGSVVQTAVAGLAWIAGGSNLDGGPYQDNVRRAADFVIQKAGASSPMAGRQRGGGNWDQTNWGVAHAAIFLGELQGHSPAKKIKRALVVLGNDLADRQEESGGWAHAPGGPNALGYVELNIVSGLALAGIGLATQAGYAVPEEVIERADAYLKASSSGDGGVGYSDKPGQKGQGNIGRTAGCWLGYRTLGEGKVSWAQKMRKWIARGAGNVFAGHASLMQHVLLAGVAAQAVGGKAASSYWSGVERDLVLARAPDGSLQPRPWHESLSMGSNSDVSFGQVWTTAAWAIVLGCEPQKNGRPGLPYWMGSKRYGAGR